MKKSPQVDLIIPTAGRFDMLEKCLNAIYANATIPVSISIIDDASAKEKRNRNMHLLEYSPEKDVHDNVVAFNVRRHEVSEGFSKSCNEGARLSSAPLVCFMNDDIEIFPDYFDKLVERMKDKTIGVCGARLIFPEDAIGTQRPAGKIQHVGVALGIRGEAMHPLIGWSKDNPKTKVSRECFAVTGALLVIRRELFRKCGGFDLIYGRGYWEDVDLCLKVRQLGYRI